MARRKKREKDYLKEEVRKVLLNRVELDTDGHFITTTETRFALWGAADGESQIRFWGVSEKNFSYEADKNNKQVLFKAKKAMESLGRCINLRTDEDAAACLMKTYVLYPVVLVLFETEDGKLQLNAYTARCPSARLAIKLAVKKLDKAMDFVVTRTDMKREKPKYVEEDEPKDKKKKRKGKAKEREEIADTEDEDMKELTIDDIANMDWSGGSDNE